MQRMQDSCGVKVRCCWRFIMEGPRHYLESFASVCSLEVASLGGDSNRRRTRVLPYCIITTRHSYVRAATEPDVIHHGHVLWPMPVVPRLVAGAAGYCGHRSNPCSVLPRERPRSTSSCRRKRIVGQQPLGRRDLRPTLGRAGGQGVDLELDFRICGIAIANLG